MRKLRQRSRNRTLTTSASPVHSLIGPEARGILTMAKNVVKSMMTTQAKQPGCESPFMLICIRSRIRSPIVKVIRSHLIIKLEQKFYQNQQDQSMHMVGMQRARTGGVKSSKEGINNRLESAMRSMRFLLLIVITVSKIPYTCATVQDKEALIGVPDEARRSGGRERKKVRVREKGVGLQ